MNKIDIEKQKILEIKVGSYLYGTNTEQSDVKKTLYEKIARKLANDLNYQLFIKDKIFMFYKLLS